MEAERTNWQSRLIETLGSEKVRLDDATRRVYKFDAYTVERFLPAAIVFPTSTVEVAEVVRLCEEEGVPYTARGAGTGLSGGAMPALGGVVVSTKRMSEVIEIDPVNRVAHVQCGVPNASVSVAAAGHGLMFAPDPSSQSVSTIGGNIAENSGGPHTLKYGVTAQHVLQVKAVVSGGDIVTFGSLVPGGAGSDMIALFVGSEGTLGIATEAWLRLVPVPAEVATALVSFRTVSDATSAVSEIVARGVVPAALELMDHFVLEAVSKAFEVSLKPGTAAALLVECEGEVGEADRELGLVLDTCSEQGAFHHEVAQGEGDRARLWTARKKGIGAMGRLAPTIVTHDGVIPRSRLAEMLETVYRVAEEAGLGVANIFHAGDGNLHPCFYFDEREPGSIERAVAAGERILARCVELGGSVTGEHGIGVEKLGPLKLMFNDADLRLQTDVRAAFAPSELCNPCKVIPDQKGCVEHRSRWRGAAT
ncbi:MAG: FAD-binding oxidoreductase [Fimbriimonadaceae bacterium]